MKRRDFIFRSMQAALLLSPLLSGRKASAQTAAQGRKRVFFCVYAQGYPDADAFFPTGDENNWSLSPILAPLLPVKENMIVIDGVDIRDSGLNPAGANHARAMGKVLTAKDMRVNPNDSEGWPGDISIDQFIAREKGLSSLEMLLTYDYPRSIREQPFASAPEVFKTPIDRPWNAWDKVFSGFTPSGESAAAREARLRRLKAKKSLLDGVGGDLKRLRTELTGIEKVKLDIHEDAIRKAELSVAKDLEAFPPQAAECVVPNKNTGDNYLPTRSTSLLDTAFAGFACDRIQVGGLVWGGSGVGGTSWTYTWAGLNITDLHNDVHHNAGPMRDTYIGAAAWDWKQLGDFVKRLRDTPEGNGNMLDNTLVVGVSQFSHHHDIRRLPMVLFGTSTNGLTTGRYLKLPSTIHNDRVWTSVAHLMGLPINGFGDDPNCGKVPGL